MCSDHVFETANMLDPQGLALRTRKARVHRDTIIVLGSNYAWSMDAYCKFEPQGVQIYVAIDVYSRHVIWKYLSITGRTVISVLAYYLATVTESVMVLVEIRSDRGAEITGVADAHFEISKTVRQRAND
nr:hypothetical protein CFP56_02637 [Quercus suber]